MVKNVDVKVPRNEFPPGMATKMLGLVKEMDAFADVLKPFISMDRSCLDQMCPLDRAKLELIELYSVNSLFWVLMQSSDDDASSLKGDYKLEMGRLKEAQERIAQLEAKSRRARIDAAASARFVKRGLGLPVRSGEDGDLSDAITVECDDSVTHVPQKKCKMTLKNEDSQGSEDNWQ